jgi:hypothetical protein
MRREQRGRRVIMIAKWFTDCLTRPHYLNLRSSTGAKIQIETGNNVLKI